VLMIYLTLLRKFWPAIPIILLLMIAGSLQIENTYLKADNVKLRADNFQKEMTLQQLKVMGEAEVERRKKADKAADEWHAYAIEQQETLDQQPVPSTCEGAMGYIFEHVRG
jgi:hypothetical protein